MKTCFCYHRYSTDRQQDGYSLDIQRNVTVKLAKKYNLNIIDIYEDKGISGATIDKRPSMLQLLDDLKEMKPDYILCVDQDRIARGNDFWYIKSLMAKTNTSFITEKEGIIDFSDITKDALSDMMGVFAKLERSMITRRIKRAIEERASKGKMIGNLTNILGYDWKNKNIEINQNEAKIIKEIYSMYLEGNGYKVISQTLNRKDIKGKRGGRVTTELVKYILTNPIYIGYVRHGTNLYKGIHKLIISKNNFYKVQQQLAVFKKYNTTKPAKYLLTGFLKCANCGANLGGSRKKLNSGKHKPIYSCLGYRQGTCNKSVYVNANLVEDAVTERVLDFICENEKAIKERILTLADNLSGQAINIEPEKKKIKIKVDKLLDEYLDNFIDKKTYRDKTMELNKELKLLDKKINNIIGYDFNILAGTDLKNLFYDLDVDKKRKILSIFLDKVIISRTSRVKENIKNRSEFYWNEIVTNS